MRSITNIGSLPTTNPVKPESDVPATTGIQAGGIPKEKISMAKDTYDFISPDKGPDQFIDAFRRFYGPTMNA